MSPDNGSTSVLRIAAQLEETRVPFVLCTVASTSRSAPRDAGARMVVREDGTIAGTIGGGPLEAAVISEARALLGDETRASELFEASLTTTGEVHLGMKCGGEVRVLLDVVRPAARVVVFGAGHVGLKVAEVARAAEWDVLLCDDRPDRLALVADGIPRCSFSVEAVGEAASVVGAGDFAVVVTRCHEVDEKLVEALLPRPARYIGLIGSRRKAAVIFRNIRARSERDPSRDERVFSPVGLDVGSKKPGEIAVSIMAELLAVRDGRTAMHRRLPARPERRDAVPESPAGGADEDQVAVLPLVGRR